METSVILPVAVRLAIEEGLTERFGTVVRVAEVQNFWPSRVFRCTLISSGGVVPDTVIVRVPREGTARSGSDLLENEWVALEYLTALGSRLAPRFYGGRAEVGYLVSEDLGTGPSLLDLLLGEDPKVATEGVLSFAQGLGQLHAQTVGCNGGSAFLLPHIAVPIREHWQLVREAVASLGLPAPRGVDGAVAEIARTLAEPGDYLALSSGDPSVVNCKVTHGGVRFFDFEEARFRHALVDATVLRFLYPTGGPPWQLPHRLTRQIESAYRTELAKQCPSADNDDSYERSMVAASAAWMIIRMARLNRVDAGPDRDSWLLLPPRWVGPVPTRSRRRQLVSIIATWVASANQIGEFTALVDWCEQVIDALRDRWPEATEELPLYPAFHLPSERPDPGPGGKNKPTCQDDDHGNHITQQLS